MLFHSLTDDEIHQIALRTAQQIFSDKVIQKRLQSLKFLIHAFKPEFFNTIEQNYHNHFHLFYIAQEPNKEAFELSVRLGKSFKIDSFTTFILILYVKWRYEVRRGTLVAMLEGSRDLIQGEVISQPIQTFAKAVIDFQLETSLRLPEWIPEFDSADF